MKNNKLLFLFLTLIVILTGLVSCTSTGDNKTSSTNTPTGTNIPTGTDSSTGTSTSEPEQIKYSITYNPGEGTGVIPEVKNYIEGSLITLIENPFIREGYIFTGWLYNNTVYEALSSFEVPAVNVVFEAQWEKLLDIPNPSFTKDSYEYDRLGGGDLELPIELDGANLVYIELDEIILTANEWFYDSAKKSAVIIEEIVLGLAEGEHTIIAVTDAEVDDLVSCKLIITQSLKTSFDEVKAKNFVYGSDSGVSFNVDYNTTIPVKLTLEDGTILPEDCYSYDDNTFTVKANILSKINSIGKFVLYLSNNDSYEFSITNNILFTTDYDLALIHDTTESNLGLNPLYQYYGNVSIVEGPLGMNGNVLKITPNTEEVTYDCNGYITLRTESWDSTWYKIPFNKDKYYVVSFDYMTEGTSVGEFSLKSANTAYSKKLLLGEENDNVVHHFQTVVTPEEFGNGIMIWAKFIGGGGNVYIDNYFVAEIDEIPSIKASGNYFSGDYSLEFDNANLAYKVLLNDEEIECSYSNGHLVIPEETMKKLEPGAHSLRVVTNVIELTVDIQVVDNRVAEFTGGVNSYSALNPEPVKVYGTFDDSIELISLTQKVKNSDNGYTGGWEFIHNDTTTNYASLATLVTGQNGEGYLQLPVEFLDKLWGQTTFIAEFSNGSKQEFVIDSVDVPMFTNYDETTLSGYLNGGYNSGSPLNSGLWGGSIAGVEPREDGKGNAFIIRSTEGAADLCAFTVRFHEHPWSWYNVYGKEGSTYRVTFTYQISENLADKETYFYIMSLGSENKDNNFFGNYDALDYVAGDDYHKVRYNLIADGQIHTFDSGWFTYSSVLRMIKIQLPAFTQADNAFVMLDDYRIVETDGISNPFEDLSEYYVGQDDSISFNIGTQNLIALTINGNEIEYTNAGGFITLDKNALDSLPGGQAALVLKTDFGTFKGQFMVSDNRISNLIENFKEVNRGQDGVILAGEFDKSLEVLSITRQGSIDIWDASVANPMPLSSSYIKVKENGLELSRALIDQAYAETKYNVVLSNGKQLSFTLNSNTYFYSNYDETSVFATLGGNNVACQDALMWEIVNTDGNNKVKYTPSKATQGHAVAAINGNGKDNLVFTFSNTSLNNYWFWPYAFDLGDTITVFFDYEVYTGDKESLYQFSWIDKNVVHHTVSLSGSGSFSIDIKASEFVGFGINCPAASPDLVADTYMLIDNFGFSYARDSYLNEHSKNIVYNQESEVIFAGKFDSSLSVKSAVRNGSNTLDAARVSPTSISPSYFTLSESGLVVSKELINQIYGTEVIWITLSNDDVVRISLTSNLLFYTNSDEVSLIDLAPNANVKLCQDTGMWSIAGDTNKHVEYRPENATLGHSAAAMNGSGMDNRVFTFSNVSLNNYWWMEYALPSEGKIIFFFDYEVVNNDKNPAYSFQWLDKDGIWHIEALTGSNTFYIELDSNNLVAFSIGCPAASVDEISGTYLIIDNLGFGLKA